MFGPTSSIIVSLFSEYSLIFGPLKLEWYNLVYLIVVFPFDLSIKMQYLPSIHWGSQHANQFYHAYLKALIDSNALLQQILIQLDIFYFWAKSNQIHIMLCSNLNHYLIMVIDIFVESYHLLKEDHQSYQLRVFSNYYSWKKVLKFSSEKNFNLYSILTTSHLKVDLRYFSLFWEISFNVYCSQVSRSFSIFWAHQTICNKFLKTLSLDSFWNLTRFKKLQKVFFD